MARKIYTYDDWWGQGNQRYYRVNKALELAQRVFEDASFNPSVHDCFLGIRLKDDNLERGYFSLGVDLNGNGIRFRDAKYKASAERLADILETDERLGKFVLVKEASLKPKTVYCRGPPNDLNPGMG
ncbi:MAG: hypothetical protein WCI72_06195 [archaeon]